MLPFLQETGAESRSFRRFNPELYAASAKADNEGVRRQLPFALLALAVSYGLAAGHVGSAWGFAQAAAPSTASHSAPAPDARIDINSASLDELMKAPGMTRTWAARIVRYRPYRAKNELLDKGVVSDEVYERIKDYVIAHHIKQ